MRRLALILAIVIGVMFASYGVGYAITSFYKQLVGVGNVTFNQEVDIFNIQVTGPSSVKVITQSTANTEADYVYTVTLYLDFEAVAPTQTVSFTAPQIPDVKKTITFSSLSLGAVSDVGAEVTR